MSLEAITEVCPRCEGLISFQKPEEIPLEFLADPSTDQRIALLALCPKPLCFGVVEVGTGRRVMVRDFGMFPRNAGTRYATAGYAVVTEVKGTLYGRPVDR